MKRLFSAISFFFLISSSNAYALAPQSGIQNLLVALQQEQNQLTQFFDSIHQSITKRLSMDTETADIAKRAVILYYERAYLFSLSGSLEGTIHQLKLSSDFQDQAMLLVQSQNRLLSDTEVFLAILRVLGIRESELVHVMEYFNIASYKLNQHLSQTGNYHYLDLGEGYQRTPTSLPRFIEEFLSRQRQEKMTNTLEEWFKGFRRRRLSGREATRGEALTQKRAVILHNGFGHSVLHPHQQLIFLPPEYLPESKVGLERFAEDYPNRIRWYEDREGVQFGELFGWPNTVGIVEGEDFVQLAERVYELAQALLKEGLKFNVLLSSTEDFHPRFFILSRLANEESLRPNRAVFGNMWATPEMAGQLIMVDESKLNQVTMEDVLLAYQQTTSDPLYKIFELPEPQNIPPPLSAKELADYFDLFYIPSRDENKRLRGAEGSKPGDLLAYYHWSPKQRGLRLNGFTLIANFNPFAPDGIVIVNDDTGPQELSEKAIRNMLKVWAHLVVQAPNQSQQLVSQAL